MRWSAKSFAFVGLGVFALVASYVLGSRDPLWLSPEG